MGFAFRILLPLILLGSFCYFIRQLLQISTRFICTSGAAALWSSPCCCCFYRPVLLGDLKTSGKGANKYVRGVCGPDSVTVHPWVAPSHHPHCIRLMPAGSYIKSFFLWVLVSRYSKNKHKATND